MEWGLRESGAEDVTRRKADDAYIRLKVEEETKEIYPVNPGPLSPVGREFFEQAREYASSYLLQCGFDDAARKVREYATARVVACDGMEINHGGKKQLLDIRVGVDESDVIYLARQTDPDQRFKQDAVHELMHVASASSVRVVHANDSLYVQYRRGLAREPIGNIETHQEFPGKLRFLGLNEAITETMARLAVPTRIARFNEGSYKEYRYLLRVLLKGMVRARAHDPSPLTLEGAWRMLLDDYLHGTFKCVAEIDRAFGRGSARVLSIFGERGFREDMKILEKFARRDDYEFRSSLENMRYGEESSAYGDIDAMEQELRGVIPVARAA